LVVFVQPAYAYIDPGTGSIVIQFVTGGVAGVAILARLYWRRLKGVFKRENADSDRDLQPPNRPPAGR